MTRGIDLGIDGLSDYRFIGGGGFAKVYSAYEARHGRRVAVKVLDTIDEAGRRAFERECRMLGTAGFHRHIVTLLDSTILPDGTMCLKMEYMAGRSLADRLEARGPLPWDEAIEVAIAIGTALEFTHDRKIIHLDIKPANLLVSETGDVKLSDFGIARVWDTTRTGPTGFSAHYSPPETFGGPSGEDLRDHRADLYSLAATLYALGVGRPPFPGVVPDAVIDQVRRAPVPRTGHGAIDAVLARAMAKDPDDRHQSATELLDDLRRIRTDLAATTLLTPANRGRWAEDGQKAPDLTLVERRPARRPRPDQADGDPRPAERRARQAPADAPVVDRNERKVPTARPSRVPLVAVTVVGLALIVALVSKAMGGGAAETMVSFGGHRVTAGPSDDDAVHDVVRLDDSVVASSGSDGRVRMWNVDDGRQVAAYVEPYRRNTTTSTSPGTGTGTGTETYDATFAVLRLADGRLASGGADGIVDLWDPAAPDRPSVLYRGHQVGPASNEDDDVYALVQLASGEIASASADGTVQIWDSSGAFAARDTYEGHRSESGRSDAVRTVIQLSDGLVASGGADGTVQIWDPGPDTPMVSIYTGHQQTTGSPGVRSICELADGRMASGGDDGAVRIWERSEGGPVEVTVYGGHLTGGAEPGRNPIRAIVQLADGRIASGGADGTVRIWELREQETETLAVFTGHRDAAIEQVRAGTPSSPATDPATTAATSAERLGLPDGSVNGLLALADGRIVSTGADGFARVWDPDDLPPPPTP